MSGTERFYCCLAWACYAFATRFVSVTVFHTADNPLDRVHILVLGCFFLLLAIRERSAASSSSAEDSTP